MGLVLLPEFSMTVRNVPDTHIVALSGELDAATSPGLADALLQTSGSTVVVDLSGLTFMDSSGIGTLVVARNRIMAEGLGQLVLTRPDVNVAKVLDIVGLDDWIVEWSPDWDE